MPLSFPPCGFAFLTVEFVPGSSSFDIFVTNSLPLASLTFEIVLNSGQPAPITALEPIEMEQSYDEMTGRAASVDGIK